LFASHSEVHIGFISRIKDKLSHLQLCAFRKEFFTLPTVRISERNRTLHFVDSCLAECGANHCSPRVDRATAHGPYGPSRRGSRELQRLGEIRNWKLLLCRRPPWRWRRGGGAIYWIEPERPPPPPEGDRRVDVCRRRRSSKVAHPSGRVEDFPAGTGKRLWFVERTNRSRNCPIVCGATSTTRNTAWTGTAVACARRSNTRSFTRTSSARRTRRRASGRRTPASTRLRVRAREASIGSSRRRFFSTGSSTPARPRPSTQRGFECPLSVTNTHLAYSGSRECRVSTQLGAKPIISRRCRHVDSTQRLIGAAHAAVNVTIPEQLTPEQ
jgi:hypothetical protein